MTCLITEVPPGKPR